MDLHTKSGEMKLQEAPETKINKRHRDREWERRKKGGREGQGK